MNFTSLIKKKLRHFLIRIILNKCFIMALLISTTGNALFSVQRQSWGLERAQRRAQPDGAGLPQAAEAELAQLGGVWPSHFWLHKQWLPFLLTSLLMPMSKGVGSGLLLKFLQYLSPLKHQWEFRRGHGSTCRSNKIFYLSGFDI